MAEEVRNYTRCAGLNSDGNIMVIGCSNAYAVEWLELISVQTARVGIASTLMAMTPILSLPLVRYVLRERVSPRALFGTLVAMAGIAVMLRV